MVVTAVGGLAFGKFSFAGRDLDRIPRPYEPFGGPDAWRSLADTAVSSSFPAPVALVSSRCTIACVRARPRNVKLYYEISRKVNNYVECAIRGRARSSHAAHADPRPRARAPGQKSTAENRLEKCSLAVPTSAARCAVCAPERPTLLYVVSFKSADPGHAPTLMPVFASVERCIYLVSRLVPILYLCPTGN